VPRGIETIFARDVLRRKARARARDVLRRYLHNQTAAKIERRLQVAGLHTVVMPIKATV
jgi:hypothetical protein